MKETVPAPSAEVQAFLEAIGSRERMLDRDLAEIREEARSIARTFAGPPEAVAIIEELDVGGVPARLYQPRGGEREALVWFHGGAWMLGGLDDHDALACALATRAECAVLSVDYRLAPEHPYPAAVHDCWTALAWASGRFERLAVGGDSSGGNLAAAMALRARDAAVSLALQLLVYPAVDPDLDGPYVDEFVTRYVGFAGKTAYGHDALADLRRIWEVYVPDSARRRDRDVAPTRAGSLQGVAPAVVVLAEHDILRGQGELYAKTLRAAGVPVEVHIYDGQIHGFYHLLAAFADARDAVERSAAALRRALASRNQAPAAHPSTAGTP